MSAHTQSVIKVTGRIVAALYQNSSPTVFGEIESDKFLRWVPTRRTRGTQLSRSLVEYWRRAALMAGGPAKYLAQLILMGSQVIGRAFAKALREEIQKSQAAAASRGGTGTSANSGDSSRVAAMSSRMGMTTQEAKQILNITSPNTEKVDPQVLQEKFDHLFKVNDKAQGGSFYLQSKVVRAKERLEEELKMEEEKPPTRRRNVRSSDLEK